MQHISFDLKNKVIVITGATGALGGEVAKYFALQEAKVVFLGRNQETLDKITQPLKDGGSKVLGIQTNVLSIEDLKKAKEIVLNEFGTIDVLVNAAGGNVAGAVIQPNQSFFEMSIDDFTTVTELNLQGTVYPTMVFGEVMKNNKKGVVLNFSSMAADRAITRVVGYSAAKGAVDNLTKWLAVEFAKKYGEGVRVNAIAPGFFIGKQNKALLTNEDGSYTDRGKTIIQNTPFNRFGEAHEILGTVHWLCSDASSFVTGITVPVDGGFSAFSGV